PPTVRIVHSGQACNVEEERYSERVYTIREGETLELQCLVTGHPRPQVPADWEHWEYTGNTIAGSTGNTTAGQHWSHTGNTIAGSI
ncbi:MAM domain-containing glycosylphosphatidylinositol anchor protein 2-like, partial [Scomber scombrus]